jgi:hypothetical protein
MAIDVDLDGERQPGLQTNVNQSELGIEEAIIKNPLLPRPTDELRTIGTRYERKGRTRFLGGEDADEPLGGALIADEVLCSLVLAELASAILVYAAGLPGPALSVLDQAV